MTAALLTIALHALCPHAPTSLAAIVLEEATRNDLEPTLLLAVVYRESSCDPHARGAAGDAGLMQLLPGGSALAGHRELTDAQLDDPRTNLSIGAAFLARVRDRCGGAPERWLSAYSGRRCGSSRYSRAILQAAVRADAAIGRDRELDTNAAPPQLPDGWLTIGARTGSER